MHRLICLLVVFVLPCLLPAQTEKPLRIAVAGLVHGHVEGFLLRPAQTRKDIIIVGIFEPNTALAGKIAKQYGYPQSMLYTNLDTMLDRVMPDAVATFTNTFDHATVVESVAPRHLPVMMEKPLAVSVEHARRIQRAADRYGIQVVVNYETSWYASHRAIWDLINEKKAMGDIRRIVAMDGHQGPKEIGVGPEFLSFLRNPALNGAGALFDFGCYGANLMTWLMGNQRPSAVMAMTRHIKPDIYPEVEDDATILLEYPKAQGVVQASWNWPFGRKDLEAYAERGYAIATGGNSLRVRLPDRQEEVRVPAALPAEEHDALAYFSAVAKGKRKSTGLSSLENNVIVTEILEAARQSARTGNREALTQKRE
jgi:predicted dehydrogenase